MKYLKPSIYILLTLAFLWSCWFSFTIYTSLLSERLPWYEPCGLQFLAILTVSCPVMYGVGMAYLVLGRFMPINSATKILPFATATVIGLLAFGPLSFAMQIAGTICSALAAVLVVVCAVTDLARSTSEQSVMHHQPRQT
jgi:L-cysteine desulfidase